MMVKKKTTLYIMKARTMQKKLLKLLIKHISIGWSWLVSQKIILDMTCVKNERNLIFLFEYK